MNETQLGEYVGQFISSRLRPLELHPDGGSPIVVSDPAGTVDRLWAVAGDRYTSSVEYGTKTEKLRRRGQFRTVTVSEFPAEGFLPSEVL